MFLKAFNIITCGAPRSSISLGVFRMLKTRRYKTMEDKYKINIASSWDTMTLGQMEAMVKANEEGLSILEIMSILSDKSLEEIQEMPYVIIEQIKDTLEFLSTPPNPSNPSNTVTINGEEYTVNNEEKMKVGEYVAVNQVVDADPYAYSMMLAILCRKKGETYNDDFVANTLEDRIAMFKSLPMTKAMPLVGFFLMSWQLSRGSIRESTVEEIKDRADQLAQSIESSLENTGATIFSKMRWRTRLARLRRQIRCM